MINNKGENIDKFIVDNLDLFHYLINKYASSCSLIEKKELHEDLIIKYLNCCKLFDDSKGYHLSALLSKMIINEVHRFKGRDYLKRSFFENMCDYNGTCNNGAILSEVIENKKCDTSRTVFLNEVLDYLDSNFKYSEKYVFKKYLDGYIQSEIAKDLNITQAQVSRLIKKVKYKIIQEFEYKM